MKSRRTSGRMPRAVQAFDAQALPDPSGTAQSVVEYAPGEAIFKQGEACEGVLFIQAGGVKVTVMSKTGREAIVGMLDAGDFFGEGCLAGQRVRMSTATAMTPSVIQLVAQETMVRLLHRQHRMSDRFIAHTLSRHVRIEEDLIDQLVNSCEKRLARALLLLARDDGQDQSPHVVPAISQTTLAEMVGSTRSRVNFFLNKFRRLGYIDYKNETPVTIHPLLLTLVLHD